ncbi:hypothetical protein VNO77_08983 [Canavalia gladiata]|uniref:Uncharacterized protein n=1 Tax=Canavalia gladiata TaxID=3824 RepID=A0AAN9MAF3_CANGL
MGAILAIGFKHLSFEPDGHIAWFWAWRASSEEKKYPGTSSGAVTRIGHFGACNAPCSLSIGGGGRARYRLLHHQSRIAMPENRLVACLLLPDEDWAPTHEFAAPYFPSSDTHYFLLADPPESVGLCFASSSAFGPLAEVWLQISSLDAGGRHLEAVRELFPPSETSPSKDASPFTPTFPCRRSRITQEAREWVVYSPEECNAALASFGDIGRLHSQDSLAPTVYSIALGPRVWLTLVLRYCGYGADLDLVERTYVGLPITRRVSSLEWIHLGFGLTCTGLMAVSVADSLSVEACSTRRLSGEDSVSLQAFRTPAIREDPGERRIPPKKEKPLFPNP